MTRQLHDSMTSDVDIGSIVDPSRLEAARGLERVGERWTLFGLSLEPDDWLRASPEVQAAIGALYVPPTWRPDDPAVLHGLIVGARCDLRAVARAGVEIEGRAWADLGGAEGYYAIALLLEGASRVVLVDEDSPRPLALRVLEQAGVEVVVADAESVSLAGIDAILALYSIEPRRVLLAHPRIRTALVAPARDPWDRGSTRPMVRGFQTRVAKWSTRLLMGEGACALADREAEVEMAVYMRSAVRGMGATPHSSSGEAQYAYVSVAAADGDVQAVSEERDRGDPGRDESHRTARCVGEVP